MFNARWGNTCTSNKQPFTFRAVYWNISRLDFPDCRFVDDFFAPTRGFSTPARGFSTALGGAVSVVLANSTLTGRGSVISCRRSSSASTCFFRLTIPTETMWRFPLRRSGHFAASPCSSTWTMSQVQEHSWFVFDGTGKARPKYACGRDGIASFWVRG